MPYQRISVRGTSGSGKSTLAQSIAKRLQIPCVARFPLHLPNWQESTDDEFVAKVRAATSGDNWVVDGNYHVVREVFEARADTVVWLKDYSRPLIMARVIRRTLLRVALRQECCNGNREDLRRTTSPSTPLSCGPTQHTPGAANNATKLFSGRHQDFEATHRFRSPKEADLWLRSLTTEV